MTTIKRYIQGQSESDYDLFGQIGPWVAWKKLHETLGMPITSEPGDIWFVATSKSGLAGFAQARRLKSKPSAHIRFAFASDVPDKTMAALLKDIEAWAKAEGIAHLYTNERKTALAWEAAGYRHNGNIRGSFTRWEKDLKK